MKQVLTQFLIVEKADNELWGRVKVNNNIIIEFASSFEKLQKKLREAILEIENTKVEKFEVSYDLTSFFERYSFLNISDIAKRAGINSALMRQYASGVKFPSAARVKEIEDAIRQIGKELAKVKLHKGQRAVA